MMKRGVIRAVMEHGMKMLADIEEFGALKHGRMRRTACATEETTPYL